MATNTIKTRIQHKHGTAASWESNSSFVPLAGELIIYDTTPPQVKIGNGETSVGSLPFIKARSDVAITTGTTNGTISVTIDGSTNQVAVKGLGSNAYTSTAYLPLSGGKLKGSSDVPLEISSATEDGSYIRFTNNSGTILGWIGYTGQDNPIISGGSNDINYTILHAGNYSNYIKTLTYPAQLTTDEAIDDFNYANSFSATTWNNTSSPGVSNGIILDMAWTSASYGAQIAIDDDPTYYMALRQKDENGWKAWKRIPMADGTGASGTWGISVSGSAYSVRDAGDGRTLTFNYSADGMTNDTVTWVAAWNGSTLQGIHKNNLMVGAATKAAQDGNGNVISSTYLPLSGGTISGNLTLTGDVISKGLVYSSRTGAEAQVHADGDSGAIFLFSESPSTAALGLYYKLVNGTSGHIARVTQDNRVSLYGNVIGSLNGVKLEWNNSIAWADTGWIAAWNSDGTLIKALNKNNFAPASHTHSYLPLSGGTMTGKLQVNDLIVGYNYTKNGNNVAVFVWDKPGSNWTGIGANAEQDTIYFGACDGSGNWISDYRQKWKFNGSLIVGGGDDNCNIVPWANNYSTIGTESLKWWKIYATNIYGESVYGAVWNDYAEYRQANSTTAGRVVHETVSGIMELANERLLPACEIISDTFGFAIGETDNCKTPIACTGRVLAYTDKERDTFNIGDAVCSGANGTVSVMTREEIREYPDRIIGYVSEIPQYEVWGTGNVKVNGRIWIRIR